MVIYQNQPQQGHKALFILKKLKINLHDKYIVVLLQSQQRRRLLKSSS